MSEPRPAVPAQPLQRCEGVVVGRCTASVLVWLGNRQVIALAGHPDQTSLVVEDIVRVNARAELDEETHLTLARGIGKFQGDSFTFNFESVAEVRRALILLDTHMFRRFHFESILTEGVS